MSGNRDHVIGLIAENENSALAFSTLGFGRMLEQVGYSFEMIDLLSQDGFSKLGNAFERNNIAFVFGYAGVGSRLPGIKSRNVWTEKQIPFVSLWFDHPSYNYAQHIVDSPFILNVYHIKDHIDFKQTYLPKNNRSIFLPQTSGQTVWKNRVVPERRSNKIAYIKTADPPELYEEKWKGFSPTLRIILHTLSELAIKDRNIDLGKEAAKVFEDHNIPRDNLDDFMGVIQEVDRYVRGWRSAQMVRALLPFPACIFGRGWDQYKNANHCAVFQEACAPSYAIQFMSYQRLSANTSPIWKSGVHERVYQSIMLGCITLTDRSIKSDEDFGDLPFYIGFEWNDNLQDVIAHALREGEKGIDYRQAGQERIEKLYLATPEKIITPIIREIEAMRRNPVINP